MRMTMTQALVKHLCAQKTTVGGDSVALFCGVWSIFGHGNVPALGEALAGVRESLPTWRGQNEQAMVHAALGYTKQMRRQRMMAVTSSIGPGASNMLTGAATAYVNRLPVLLLPGDVFASRRAAPVLQEIERPEDATISVNDAFRPVSSYFDRLMRPEQLLHSLPRAINVLTDPELSGPATLCLPQDVQAEAYDFPDWFFDEKHHVLRRPGADPDQLQQVARLLRAARRPVLVAGGGVHYSGALQVLQQFVEAHAIPLVETSAGKGALPYAHPLNAGGIGVVGTHTANAMVEQADLVIAVGTRLSDFVTGSRSVLSNVRIPQININVAHLDAYKHNATGLRSDARRALEELAPLLAGWRSEAGYVEAMDSARGQWQAMIDTAVNQSSTNRPSEAQVTEVLNRSADLSRDVLVLAAGSMPAEGLKMWRGEHGATYHAEYGYSCMGYEIPAGIGVKMASPEATVYVVVGDGTYLMMNSEIVTSVALGQKLVIVVLDNRGFGCINRLQNACGAAPFNNLFDDGTHTSGEGVPQVDFAAHAASMGAQAEHCASLDELPAALERARQAARTAVVVIQTNAVDSLGGGSWWQVGIPEASGHDSVLQARAQWQDVNRERQPW